MIAYFIMVSKLAPPYLCYNKFNIAIENYNKRKE